MLALFLNRGEHASMEAQVSDGSAEEGKSRQSVVTLQARGVQSLRQTAIVTFERRELQAILALYGKKVAEGEWRDYAIDFHPTHAVFSVFKRSSESPLFRIQKTPDLARKQGAYSIVASGGLILKRGQDLARVLEVLEKKSRFVVI
jgi:hypothetical protein